MSDLIARILPLALAGAISPTVLAICLVILSSPKSPKARGLYFLAGVTTVTVAISLLVVFGFGNAVPESQKGTSSHLAGYIDLAFAAILILLAVLTYATRNRKKKDDKPDPVTGVHPLRYYAIGLVIMLGNFTTLAVFLPALKDIAIDKIAEADRILAMVMVDVIVLTPAWLPVGLYLISPATAKKVLTPLNEFLQRHRTAVGITICLVFAAYLTFLGVKALSG